MTDQFPSESPRDTDALHHAIREHIIGCKQCQEAESNTKPVGWGQKSRMCPEYFRVISAITGAPLPDGT